MKRRDTGKSCQEREEHASEQPEAKKALRASAHAAREKEGGREHRVRGDRSEALHIARGVSGEDGNGST